MRATPMTTALEPEISLTAVQKAIQRAQHTALRQQAKTGVWNSPGYLGPGSTARTLLALHFVGRLDEEMKSSARDFFSRMQRPDGSFHRYPKAKEGDLVTTAAAWAAMRVVGFAEEDAAVQKAWAFVQAQGGLTRVADQVYCLDPEGIFIALAGMLDPQLLPAPPAELLLIPGMSYLMVRYVNAYGLWMFPAVAAIVRHLRGEPVARFFPDAAQRMIELIASFQNEEGSFNDVVDQTALAAAAFFALGLPSTDPRLDAATNWICKHMRRRGKQLRQELSSNAFPTNVWTTALTVRALLASGLPRSNPHIAKAVRWLAEAQINGERPPPLIPIPAGSPGTGGWGFEWGNVTTPDCDDTAVALGSLGMVLERDGSDALDDATAQLAREAVERGLAWQLPMQNDDGGWPAFQHGLQGKPPGPIFTVYPPIPKGFGLSDLLLLSDPYPLIFGDPATEDITARTLFALAANGYTIQDPAVARAVEFLKAQQCTAAHLGNVPEQGDGGAWWSRWICSYLTATAYAIGGLAAVGVDVREPWVRRAIQWIKLHQNADGGWGEEPTSYQDPRLAGIGPSTPALTGLVLTGLIQAGEGDSPEVARGIEYLLQEQRSDGTWPSGQMLHVFFKVNTLYILDAAASYYPLEAIGRYQQLRQGKTLQVDRGDVTRASLLRAAAGVGDGADPAGSARDGAGNWNDSFLEAMRQVGDREADATIQEIFAEGELDAVNTLLATFLRSDAPIPDGLPPRVSEYFERTAALPTWADPKHIALAQQLFTRCGWTGAIALFCSSLPQAYAAAKGAKVLVGTQGMTRHVERRVFETAQFVFDVMDEGALSAKGRGVRAAQKLRLVHAAIRHLTLRDASWDMAWGVPINQEDSTGTLMTFSCVLLDAWNRLGLKLTAEEAEAWLHAWKVIGYVMGIHPELLPRDVADAEALMDAIRRLQWAPSPEGQQLTAALVDMMDRHLPPIGFKGLPATVMRYLAGGHCCDLLGLPPADWSGALLQALSTLESRLSHPDHDSALRAMINQMAFAFMKSIVLVERSGKQARFRIPPALLHQWGLAD